MPASGLGFSGAARAMPFSVASLPMPLRSFAIAGRLPSAPPSNRPPMVHSGGRDSEMRRASAGRGPCMRAAQPIQSRFPTRCAAGACDRTPSMTETLSGFAALALLGFVVAFGLLMLFMALVQPIWCVVDCAIDGRRGMASKVVWIIVLILLWSVANWFYGAFAAGNA